MGFGSGSGTNLRECAKVIAPALIFSNNLDAKLFNHAILLENPNIQYEVISSRGYKGKREEYDSKVLDMLHKFEDKRGYGIDLIVLGGYMRIVSEVILNAYPDKIINVHPAEIDILAKGKRKYIGGDAVFDAINAGEIETRSSVIMVDAGTDHGEILTQGKIIPVDKNYLDMDDVQKAIALREYVDGEKNKKGHQEIQKESSDWPALTLALELIANGRLALGTQKTHFNEWRTVYLDGKALLYNGFVLD